METMFTYYDGNSGRDYIGDYADCMAEASDVWYHLTIEERKRYTDADNGAHYCVVDCDTMITIWDIMDLIEDEPLDCERYGFELSNSGERI